MPALQIVFHRLFWSFLLIVLLLTLRRDWEWLRGIVAESKTFLVYSLAGTMLAGNWLLYVWAINAGYIIEASLGYFISPLASVTLGILLLHEKLRPLQWLPVGIAAAGVLYLTWQFGQLPWIALLLAFSFSLYALFKKVGPLNSMQGLSLETAVLFLPSLAYLVYVESRGSGAFGHSGSLIDLLLALSGVITLVPLLFFAWAVQSVPLSLMGLLQYIAPSCQLLTGLLIFGEEFTNHSLIGFSLIWIALALFSVESYLVSRTTKARIKTIEEL